MSVDKASVAEIRDRYRLTSKPYYDRDGLLDDFKAMVMPHFEQAQNLTDFYKACDLAFYAWCDLFSGAKASRDSIDKQWGFLYARYIIPHKMRVGGKINP